MRRRLSRAAVGPVMGGVALLLVLAGAARAAPPPEEAPVAAPAPAPASEGTSEADDIEVDAIIPTASKSDRWYRILGVYELHFNVISDDYSAADWLSWFMLRTDFNVTRNNQLSLRIDLEQRHIADPGETGLYLGDLRLYYSRKFTLPIPGFPIPGKASIYLTAPTSQESRRRSYITRPTALLTFAPRWGPLTLLVTGAYRYSFAQYAESSERGAPNERQLAGFVLQLVYAPLDWFAPSFTWESTWSEPYPTREGTAQDWQGAYRFEFALNFSIPLPESWPSLDLSLAYAQGASLLEDGVYRTYFAKRDQSEIYFGLNLAF